ncbi:MAG: molybdenum cofactor guanylyltransferase [Armatimonadetes bacterium]|nr:molybdenum cofactor guanylyltransferase [Armatimonadota bacterium]
MLKVNSVMAGFGAAILAGGKATRLGGIEKALIEIEPGVTMLEKIARQIELCGPEEIIVLANDPEPYGKFGCPVIHDLTPGIGPLAGIEAGLSYYRGRHDTVLFVPCDVPRITAVELSALVQAFRECGKPVVYAETGDFFAHPLCSVVHIGALETVSEVMTRGVRKVKDVWLELGAVPVHFDDPAPFVNVNTPEDVARWRCCGQSAARDGE